MASEHQSESGQAVRSSAVVRPHPWQQSFLNKQKLAAARKQRDKRYWRDWHRADRADETYKQAEHERDVMRRSNDPSSATRRTGAENNQ